jgi:hypothetical protein
MDYLDNVNESELWHKKWVKYYIIYWISAAILLRLCDLYHIPLHFSAALHRFNECVSI